MSAVKCCGVKSAVIDSRLTPTTIRRRRECPACGARWTTEEWWVDNPLPEPEPEPEPEPKYTYDI